MYAKIEKLEANEDTSLELEGVYQAYYENIHQAICGEAELIVKPEEARNTIRIIELAVQSNAEKRTILV